MNAEKNYTLSRYERHIDVPEIGLEGQKKIFQSSVLIIGVGGLGCPSAIYLNAAGIGKIGLIDADIVSTSNLQRQILFNDDDVGKLKVDVAKKKLSLNKSHCDIKTYPFFINGENAIDIVQEYDIVLDCTDNFEARYTINDLCFRSKKPLISASIYHYDGQISVFRGFDAAAPCYQCLYKKTDQNWIIPQCKDSGIVGPLAGIIGTMQATAALNELLGIQGGLVGWMYLVNALTFETQKIKIEKRHDCETCSQGERNSPQKNSFQTMCALEQE